MTNKIPSIINAVASEGLPAVGSAEPSADTRAALAALREAIRNDVVAGRFDGQSKFLQQDSNDEDWQTMLALATEEVEFGEAVFGALLELENGDHATAGRDFGRGIAYAAQHIRDAIHEHYESRGFSDDHR